MSFAKKFNRYGQVFLKEDAAMPLPEKETPEGDVPPTQGDATDVPPMDAPETSAMAPSAEVLLIRDLLKALVIQLPSDAEVTNLVNTEVPDKLTKDEAETIHEKVNSIIERYRTFENNEGNLQKVEKIVVNENNRRQIYKQIIKIMEKYSH